jgi:hypothetical protein
VQELVALAMTGQMSEHNVEVGQTLGESLVALPGRAAVTVTDPSGAREEVRMALDVQASRWAYADTHQSGVYRVEVGAPIDRREAFAVNVNTAESDLAKLAPEELPRQFATQRQTNLDDVDAPALRQRSGLHKNLLYLVLGLLFVETFLAWRFGRATR